MKDFINDFYTYDFTRIIDNSSGWSDIEIDLELAETEDDKKEVKASASVVYDELTSRHGVYCYRGWLKIFIMWKYFVG